ncbi:MAG: hypothetical protein ACK5WB_00215 [Phycisphaerales bacterium]|jgi:hypothetical protein|nr:hypothetical protein [Phycisphaeraceae bacterium]MTA11620.1 hypothetical protein [Actinomycetota bacterium]
MTADQGKQSRLRARDLRMQADRLTRQARVVGRFLDLTQTELAQTKAAGALAQGTLAIAAAAERLCDRLQQQQAIDMHALADLQRLVIEHRAALAEDRAVRNTGASA